MVKNKEAWKSWEQDITFLRIKKSLTCASDDTFVKLSLCSGGNLQANFEISNIMMSKASFSFYLFNDL